MVKAKNISGKIKEVLEADNLVLVGYLFGSVAAKKETFLSDIDIAVLLKEGSTSFYLKEEKRLVNNLMLKLKNDKVDLIVLNVAPIELAFEIISNGQVIFNGDEKKRIIFEEKAILEFLDFKPFLDEYRYYLHKRLKEGA